MRTNAIDLELSLQGSKTMDGEQYRNLDAQKRAVAPLKEKGAQS